MEDRKRYGESRKAVWKYAITKTKANGKPYIYLKELSNTLLLTTDADKALLFDSVKEAQEYYTKYVLPNILMGDSPLHILNSISLFILSIEFGNEYTLDKKGAK